MEREFHRWLKEQTQQRQSQASSSWIEVGIGDDAAILRGIVAGIPVPGIVVTTDGLVEGTHFDLARDSLKWVGRKLIAVNLSDLAAMAAMPLAAVIQLNMPRSFQLRQAQELFRGALEIADQFQVSIVGGDTNRWDGKLAVSATLIGLDMAKQHGREAWLMSGARAGDVILATGKFGGSILGRHLSFEPRVNIARYLIEHYNIRAATDVSDSLSLDLALMLAASQQSGQVKGLGVQLDVESIPIHSDAIRLSERTGRTPLSHALTDGEDFELVLAVAADEYEKMRLDERLQAGLGQTSDVSQPALTEIGRFVAEPGFWLCSAGFCRPFEPAGYSH